MRTEKRLISTGRLLLAIGVLIVACGGVAVDAIGATGTQILPNGDMEQDGAWQSMSDGKGTVPSVNEQSFDDKHSGKASRHVVISRESSRDWPSVYSASFATETGKMYEVRFWCKVLKGGFGVVARNGAGNDNITPTPGAMCVPQYDMMNKYPIWTEYVGTYTEENGGKNAYLRFVITSSGEVAFYLIDEETRAAGGMTGLVGDALRIEVGFSVSLADYGVAIPSVLEAKVSDQIDLTLRLTGIDQNS